MRTGGRLRAEAAPQELPKLTVAELRVLASILGAQSRRRIKGGHWKRYTKDELLRCMRRVLGRGTFPDRLERFAASASEMFRERVEKHAD
jgi:hypothetical protein